MNSSLRAELLSLLEADLRVRTELMNDGLLQEGYHPQMEELHLRNAVRLKQIISEYGWPTQDLVGEDGAEAAWLVVQHAISDPPFQREMLHVLKEAAEAGAIPAYQPAYLEDRICMYEGRPQIYGTQFTPDEQGRPAPWTVADPDHVNDRRAALGLDTLEHRTAHFRSTTPDELRPKNMQQYYRDYEEWLHNVGWR